MGTNKKSGYVIFPLCALTLNIKFKRLLDYLIHYALVHLATNYTLDELGYQYVVNYETKHLPEDFVEDIDSNIFEKCLFIEADKRNVKINSIKRAKLNYCVIKLQMEKFSKDILKIGGNENSVEIRLKVSVIEDVKNNNSKIKKEGLNEDDFRVLCAIYSALGVDIYKPIYYDQIARRAMGYQSKPLFDELTKHRSQEIIGFMTIDVLRTSIKKLLIRNFFVRQYDGRREYYSKKLSEKQLYRVVQIKLQKGKIKRKKEALKNKKLKKDKMKFAKSLEGMDLKAINDLEKNLNEELNKYNIISF